MKLNFVKEVGDAHTDKIQEFIGKDSSFVDSFVDKVRDSLEKGEAGHVIDILNLAADSAETPEELAVLVWIGYKICTN